MAETDVAPQSAGKAGASGGAGESKPGLKFAKIKPVKPGPPVPDDEESALEKFTDDVVDFVTHWFGALRFDHEEPPPKVVGKEVKAKDKLKKAWINNNVHEKDVKKRIGPRKVHPGRPESKLDEEKGAGTGPVLVQPAAQKVSGFVGVWDKGTITAECTTVTWNDGLTSEIQVEGERIELNMLGDLYYGTLEGGQIRWGDGDVWMFVRALPKPVEAEEKAEDKLRSAATATAPAPAEDEVWYDGNYFVMMSRPIFSIGWPIVVFTLWFLFWLQSDSKLAGMESIWPGKTMLAIVDVNECTDYRAEIYRWWTYQFSHAGFSHVFMNCLMVLLFGVPIEGWHGTLRTFVMFQIGVWGGALCFMIWDNHSQVVGMSGGCYSLIGMQFGDLTMNFKDKKYRVAKVILLIVIVIIDIIQVWALNSQSTSHSAHFGGFVAGLLICIFAGYNKDVLTWEQVLQVAAGILGVVLVIFCLAYGLEWAPQDLKENVRWCWLRQVISEEHFGDAKVHCVRCKDEACIANWSVTNNALINEKQCWENYGGFDISE